MSIKTAIYQGTPRDIIVEVSTKIVDLIAQDKPAPNVLIALSLIHIAGALVRQQEQNPVGGDPGKPPSFAMLLTTLRHSVAPSDWSDDELKAYEEEFCAIVESLGGGRVLKGGPQEAKPFVSPPSPFVH